MKYQKYMVMCWSTLVVVLSVGLMSLQAHAQDKTPWYISSSCYQEMVQCQPGHVKHSKCLTSLTAEPVSVLFNQGGTKIKNAFHTHLDDAADCLKSHPEINVILVGFANDIGGRAYNVQLSKKRATTVREALIKRGVSADRICVLPEGKEVQFITGEIQEDRRLNRSVKLIPLMVDEHRQHV